MGADLYETLEGVDPATLTWEQAIVAFENLYMASRNLAARTREEYRADLTQLAGYFTRKGLLKPGQVQLSHLQGFLAHLDARGYAGITRRRKTAAIKTFFRFLVTSGVCTVNPVERLIPPEREWTV